jgi:DnaD/phage-associated family protein
MANPQTEDGFVRIARELWDEIIRRNFTKRQKDILFFIWRLSYGCQTKSALIPKMRHFQICGVAETKIKGELEYLEQCKVLTWDRESKIFEINKDFEKWQVSPVMGWDEEQFSSLIGLNIARKTSQKGNEKLPEKGSSENENFPKREEGASQNRKLFNEKLPETGNSTPNSPNQDAGSESPKEIFKESIKDSSTSSLEISATIADLSFGKIYKIYEEDFTVNGKVSRIEAEDLTDQFETYGGEWLLEAMKEAIRANVRTLAYINGVLNGFRKRGTCKKEKDIEPQQGPSGSESMFDEDDPIIRMMREEDRLRRGTAVTASAV